MDNEQAREDQDMLRSERKTRGDIRDAYLDAGREQARKNNAQAGGQVEAGPESSSSDSDADYEAEQQARKAVDEETMKTEARSHYDGTDESFEQDWPAIREQLINEDLQQDLERMRRRL